MGNHRRGLRRSVAARASTLALCAGLAAGTWALLPDDGAGERALPDPVTQVQPAGRTSAPRTSAPAPIIGADGSGVVSQRPVGVPERLSIPSIDVDTALQTLGLQSDGSMQSPSAWGVAGWYSGGPRPGQVGPAVVVGHIDSTSGPAVFYRLTDLHVGDAVLVTTHGGAVLHFVVDDIARFAKEHFPTDRIYGPQPIPVLRLITCTGAFDPAALSYLDNLVVSAHLATDPLDGTASRGMEDGDQRGVGNGDDRDDD